MTKRRIITAAVLVAVLAAIAGGWWFSNQAARPAVATARAETRTLTVTVSAPGTLAAGRAASVTAPTSGTLATVEVTDGQQVESGQVLGRMDAAPLEAAIARAEAELAAARAMPTGTNRLNAARTAAIHAAELTLNLARADRDRAVLKAPASGTVQFASLSLAPSLPPLFKTGAGVSVTAGLTLFTVVDAASLRFEAQVDETDIAGVQPGQTATVLLDAHPGRPLTATVEAVRPSAVTTSTGGTAYVAVLKLDAADLRLFTGMTGDADLATATLTDALVVPVQAVVVEGSKRIVWIVDAGTARRREVTVGAATDTLAQVTSGLAAGDVVATTNLTALTEGASLDVRS